LIYLPTPTGIIRVAIHQPRQTGFFHPIQKMLMAQEHGLMEQGDHFNGRLMTGKLYPLVMLNQMRMGLELVWISLVDRLEQYRYIDNGTNVPASPHPPSKDMLSVNI